MRFRHSLPTPPTPTCSDGHYDGYSPMYDSTPHQTVETCHYGYIVAVFNLKPITKQDLSCSQACFLKPKLCLQQDQMWRLSSYSVFKGESTKKFLFQPHTDHHKSKSTPFKKNDGKQHVHWLARTRVGLKRRRIKLWWRWSVFCGWMHHWLVVWQKPGHLHELSYEIEEFSCVSTWTLQSGPW